ncbi:unnamed protein product, partial [Oppiella nova]
ISPYYLYTNNFFRDSKLTSVLKECLSSRLVWTSVVANITNLEANYLDTLSVCQFVTRIHRSRFIHSTGRHKMRKLSQHNNPFSQHFAVATGQGTKDIVNEVFAKVKEKSREKQIRESVREKDF